jgi:Putative peptidoglycan binding domain/L,D-transpeptidase catalytic domain
VRRALAVGAVGLGLVVHGGTAAAGTLSLRVEPPVVGYGGTVVFAGELVPAQAGVPLGVYLRVGSEWRLVTSGATGEGGSYRLATAVRASGSFVALAQPDPATQVVSPEITIGMRPFLQTRVVGRRVVGARLVLSGRLLPADAGKLVVTARGGSRHVRVSPLGRFRVALPSDRAGRLRVAVALVAGTGYEPVRRAHSLRLRGPSLSWGSSGAAVRALERLLWRQRYAIRGVDTYFGSDTYEAILAFQKVHGLLHTGRVAPGTWRRLSRASVPRALVPHGTHIEISKTRQVLYEVRAGRVVKAVHVSTGATGNTPVGSWRVYRLAPGYNALGMYYSLYFLRGFAIHGYHSVPAWPASHGCIRTPIWFAPGFYSRWARLGTRIYIFP